MFGLSQKVTLIIVCERCKKQILKEKYRADRKETVVIKTICPQCEAKEKDSSSWD